MRDEGLAFHVMPHTDLCSAASRLELASHTMFGRAQLR